MDKFCVQGLMKFQGEVIIFGAKNVVLFIFFVVLLVEELVEIQNVLKLKDVDILMKLLSQLGVKVECNGFVYIDVCDVNVFCVFYDLVKIMCVFIWVLGLLVVCFGQG